MNGIQRAPWSFYVSHLHSFVNRKWKNSFWQSLLLTGVVRRFALQGHDLVFLLICLNSEVGKVLLHLSGHLSIFIQFLGIQKRAAAHSLLVCAALDIQHIGVGAALTQRPKEVTIEDGEGKNEERRRRETFFFRKWDQVDEKIRTRERDVHKQRVWDNNRQQMKFKVRTKWE